MLLQPKRLNGRYGVYGLFANATIDAIFFEFDYKISANYRRSEFEKEKG